MNLEYNNNNNNLLEFVFEPETCKYLKECSYSIQTGKIHKYTFEKLLTKNTDTKRKIVIDLITKCYWDNDFTFVKESIVLDVVGGCTNKKSFRHNILYYLIHQDYPENIILNILEKGTYDLNIYDKDYNTLINIILWKKKYPIVFKKLLELSSCEIINKQNSKGLRCWDIALSIENFESMNFYCDEIISSGKYNFDKSRKTHIQIIKNYCTCNGISDDNKNHINLYKIYNFNKEPELLNDYWKFYYDMANKYFFQDIYQITCKNDIKMNLVLNFIKFIGFYCNFIKTFDIDLDLFNDISNDFLTSFTNNSITYKNFYAGIQYILEHEDNNIYTKSKNYIEQYLGYNFFFTNDSQYEKIYLDFYNKLIQLNSGDNCIIQTLLYEVLLESIKNVINIDLIKNFINKIINSHSNVLMNTKIFDKIINFNSKNNENKNEKYMISCFINNYKCDDELIKLYYIVGFFNFNKYLTDKYNHYNLINENNNSYTNDIYNNFVNSNLFCQLIKIKKYDFVYKLIDDLRLDYFYYFYKPSKFDFSIFEYFLSVVDTEKSNDIIKKTGSIIFNYLPRYPKNIQKKDLNNYYKSNSYKNLLKNFYIRYPNNSPLYWACKNKMTNIAKFLLDNQLSDPNYTDSDGISVLSWSCINSMKQIGIELLEIEFIDTTKLDNSNKSALNYAIKNDLQKISTRLVEILLELMKNNSK